MDTIPNVIVPPGTITDIYAATSVAVGEQITVAILGQGRARLFSSAVAPSLIDDSSGFEELESGENATNQSGDSGAFIYSLLGCTLSVGVL
mgnify:CR=1 FL=1|tara:strand:+ start:426 stop:698 length:273 start_codon:yes stop_codon:yes gene_type:complete